jgi:3-deoxy-D-manno-octulosonic-acid transferase
MVMNARMPAGEARGYRLIGFFFRELLAGLGLVCAREPEDARRFSGLGVPAEKIHVTGNLKFDAFPAAACAAKDRRATAAHTRTAIGLALDRPVVMAGSTHPGEEEVFMDLAASLRDDFPDLFLILAPRAIRRVADLAATARERGLALQRSSAFRSGTARSVPAQDAGLIIDTLGELGTWYAMADVVFVGKSLTGRGGQDVIEAAAAGNPVVCGPHMEHFEEIVQRFLAVEAVIQVQDVKHLENAVRDLLRNPEIRQAMARRAGRVISENRGAVGRTVALLTRFMAGDPAAEAAPAGEN